MADLFSNNTTHDSATAALSIRDPHTRSDQLKRDAMNTGFLRNPIIQRLLTWQTGLPHTNQELPLHHPLENLVTSTVAMVLGFLCCHQALQGEWGWLIRCLFLVIGWSHIFHALRCYRLPNRHAAAHGFLSGNAQVDYWIGQTLSVLLLAAPMSGYISSHVKDPSKAHHNWKTLLTPSESTYEEIRALGFLPGMPNAVNWRHLRRLLISPRFYLHGLANGLHGAFFKGSIVERAFNATFWGVILMIALLTHNLGLILTAYGLPRFLYEGAQCLRVLVEHTFDVPDRPRTLASYKFLTSAIILAAEVPEIPEKVNQIARSLIWIQWGFEMVMHFIVRVYILTGDTINHLSHHYRVGSSFLNHESERMKLIHEGHAIHSNWGLVTAIDALFFSLSKQPTDFFTRNQE
jgi:hypothetical protein